LGKGLGKGISKYGYVPEDTSDFIFSIIAEELGFFGSAAVITLFVTLIMLGILVVVRCDDQFGRFLAGTIVMTIGIQAAVNIGVVTSLLPATGIPLPFVSAGGTSLLLSAAAAGVLVNIARQTCGTLRWPANASSCVESRAKSKIERHVSRRLGPQEPLDRPIQPAVSRS
jgi:cell division protein FtsW